MFYYQVKSLLLVMQCVFERQNLQMLDHKNKSDFHSPCSLEVGGRGSETQLQVGEHLNHIAWRLKCYLKVFNHTARHRSVVVFYMAMCVFVWQCVCFHRASAFM